MGERSVISVYFNRRAAALLGLGFASGLPYLMSQEIPKGWLSEFKVDIRTIGLFSFVGLPYTLKFLWAPMVDWFVPPVLAKSLGRRRAWLLITQVAIAAALLAMAMLGPRSAQSLLMPFAAMAVIVAFFSATQDIVSDAYRTDALAPAERGAGAAVFVLGYRLAMVTSNAGSFAAADYAGWSAAYMLIAVIMLACVGATFFAPKPASDLAAPRTLVDAVVHPVKQFFQSRGLASAALVLAFVFLFKLPEDFAKSMEIPLLQGELGYPKSLIGQARGVVGVVAAILGALAGGAVVARVRLIPSLWLFGILHAICNFGYWLLIPAAAQAAVTAATSGGRVFSDPALSALQPEAAISAAAAIGTSVGDLVSVHHSLAALYSVIALENFCRGLAQAGFIAFLMSQCDSRYSAFQFALLTGLMALSGNISGATSGFLVEAMGYRHYYAWAVAAGVPSLLLLIWLPKPNEEEKEPAAAKA